MITQPVSVYINGAAYDELSDNVELTEELAMQQLDELLRLLKVIKETMDIVGLDITGEYSEPEVSGSIKSFCSRLDHPAEYTARGKPSASIDTINEETNLQILGLLGR